MSDERKIRKADKLERRRHAQHAADGLPVNSVVLPPGAVRADPAQQVPNNSYSSPPLFYVDQEFVCVDCGKAEVWTARQQKWYYEVAKGSLYATAVRCRACRRKRPQGQQPDLPRGPGKSLATIFNRIRKLIEPKLLAAGFLYSGKSKSPRSQARSLEYARSGLLLRCYLDREHGELIAETLDDNLEHQVVVRAAFDRPETSTAVFERLDVFAEAVNNYVHASS